MQIEGCQKTFKDLTEAGESLITIIIATITMITAFYKAVGVLSQLILLQEFPIEFK